MSEQRKMIYVDDLRLSWLNKTTLIAYDPVDVLRSIDAQPAIDPETLPIVQELRAKLAEYEPIHAYWVEMNGNCKNGNQEYKCSRCGRTVTSRPNCISSIPYCHCGAKMDEE